MDEKNIHHLLIEAPENERLCTSVIYQPFLVEY